jgi:hypothetical protein
MKTLFYFDLIQLSPSVDTRLKRRFCAVLCQKVVGKKIRQMLTPDVTRFFYGLEIYRRIYTLLLMMSKI